MWIHTYTLVMTQLAAIAEMRHPGDSIRQRRIELGWTQAVLADHAGVSQADISRIENRRLDARWSTIQRLSEALGSSATPTRSLANGHRRRSAARPTTSTWAPKGSVSPIEPAPS